MISRRKQSKPNRAGQTLIIAIMVMFIVALTAAVFIGLVARNLFSSERYSNIDEVTQIAEAGIRYADRMLTTGEDGADWRPVPDNDGIKDPYLVPPHNPPMPNDDPSPIANLTMWEYQRDKYPDFRWSRAYWPTELPATAAAGMGYAGPTGGYTTFSTGQGRFLLRVSYNPNMSDPVSKYIKIEAIGRLGVFDENDPTTYKPHGNSNLRRELTAYKPIGLTDYLHFITNKDNRAAPFPLGCPGYSTPFGRSADSRFGDRGGPIKVNGSVMLYGNAGDGVHLYLRSTENNAGDLVPIDSMEVAGQVYFAPSTGGVLTTMGLNGNVIDPALTVSPSDVSVAGSWTQGGFIRDSYPQADEPTRRIKRLDPPVVDQPDPSNTSTRYRLLTLSSGERIKDVAGRWVNLGEYGWGRGIYIGNGRDKQADSESLLGGYSLRSDWVKPNDLSFGYWKGPYYVPPGAVIVLHPTDTDGDKQPDLSITRADSEFTTWYDAWGNPRPDWGRTVTMPYPNPNSDPDLNGRWVYAPDGKTKKHIDGNGVIYAEGNIRIRGMLPPGMQLTVVSGQNIYIDGNLLKYRDPNWTPDQTDKYRGGDPTCGLALLAKQYVCVNTTQFFAPLNGIGMDDVGSDAGQGEPPYHIIVSSDPDSRPRITFDYGPYESDSAANPPEDWYLCLRHSGQMAGASYINAWLNPGPGIPENGLLGLNNGWGPPPVPGLPVFVWGVGDPNFNAPGWGIGALFACEAFPLSAPQMNANLLTQIGQSNLLEIALDQSSFTRNNYLLGGLAVQPFDVRIEAVIYAEEGSFFVLPGNWLNPNPNDIPGRPRPAGVVKGFPYFGQPLDIRVIVDGAVSENVPAQIGDVEAWMAKWGRIPNKYGSSDVDTAHPGEGLTFLYDDHAGWPLTDPANPSPPIRTDRFGRTLPFAPRLPVCGGLIYVGDVM